MAKGLQASRRLKSAFSPKFHGSSLDSTEHAVLALKVDMKLTCWKVLCPSLSQFASCRTAQTSQEQAVSGIMCHAP